MAQIVCTSFSGTGTPPRLSREAHSAPLHRLDAHDPECLAGLAVHFGARRKSQARVLPTALCLRVKFPPTEHNSARYSACSWAASLSVKHLNSQFVTPIDRRPDRARVPVTMPRQSDGNLRRDGSSAANEQLKHPVDERGRVHGASDLNASRTEHAIENSLVYYRKRKEKRRWMQNLAKHDRLRGQDKREHIVLRSVGCFCLIIQSLEQCAYFTRNVRPNTMSQIFLDILNIAGFSGERSASTTS